MSAKFNYSKSITFKCGHSEDVTIRARYKGEADEFAMNMRASDCKECSEMKRVEEQKIAEKTAALGLPPLTGSHKQIAWANRIRVKKLEELLKMTSSITDASWWIEQRTLPPSVLAEKLITPPKEKRV